MMLSDFVLTVLFTVTLAFSSSGTHQLALGDNATVQSRNSTDNVLPLNTDLASFSVVNGSNELLRREFKRNRRIVKRNGGTPIEFTIPLNKQGRTQYTGQISVGESEEYNVVFGTASFEMWLISKFEWPIDQSVEGFEHKYSPRSATHQSVGHRHPSMTINVFGGRGTGRGFRDKVKVGEISQEMKFVAVSKVVGFGKNVGDGVFPMAPFPKGGTGGQFRIRTISFLEQAQEDGMKPVFSFALRRDGGELHLGMIDESYVEGKIKYHDRAVETRFWQVNGADIAVGTYLLEKVAVVFVTESQFCRGPEEEVKEIYKTLGIGTKLEDGSGLYEIPCGSQNLPTMMVWWSDEEQWAIPPQRFEQEHPMNPATCVGLFAAHTEFTASKFGVKTSPHPLPDERSWVLGYVFMQDLYMVFLMHDYTAGIPGKIGISHLKAGKGYGSS